MPRTKRWPTPKAKPGELVARWGTVWWDRGSPELTYAYEAPAMKGDMALIHDMFMGRSRPDVSGSYLQALEERGYDLTTLKFSIQKKET